ncbi:Reverse transcriptase domain [Cinara cedri]|uniref:Reverse transcriptase domain n=1 Tax=Cinara cedri TaxID=506608 RepID=A0A5E4NDP7_9HEMI|nr:Reverse transcriptase domain [Cinara cedri]
MSIHLTVPSRYRQKKVRFAAKSTFGQRGRRLGREPVRLPSREIDRRRHRAVLETARAAARERDLCVVVSLDVRNAFNTAPWERIDAVLGKKRIPGYLSGILRSYLSDRSLLVPTISEPRPVTCGVPQESVLGPVLWNVFYDGLLETRMPAGARLVAFADDVAVLGTANSGALLEEILNPALEAVAGWMASNGLELAVHKSEAVVLSGRRKFVMPALEIGGQRIEAKDSLRYLGVTLDRRMTFAPHTARAALAAAGSARAISRLMPNVGGPGWSKRRLLSSVVQSKALYAAPVWAPKAMLAAKNRDALCREQRRVALRIIRAYRTVSDAAACWSKRRLLSSVVQSKALYAAPVWAPKVMLAAKNRDALCREQRRVALRIIRAYRTVSDAAACVLAEWPPMDLLALERCRVASACREERETRTRLEVKKAEAAATIAAWKERWRTCTKAEWTRRLIPDLGRWLGRTVVVRLTFHLTQALTGHGCFQDYLHRRGRAATPLCLLCGVGAEDTVEHTLLECAFWEQERSVLARSARVGTFGVADMTEMVCGPDPALLPEDDPGRTKRILAAAQSVTDAFQTFVEAALGRKEVLERDRQRAERRRRRPERVF